MEQPVNLIELEQLAREKLSRPAYDYYASGADDELTLDRNRGAWDELEIHYRVLAGVGERDTSGDVLGREVAMPVLVAPTAFHGLATAEGEAATAAAAAAAGTVMTLSTLSNVAVEEVVAAAGGGPVWFQLYVYRDRAVTEALVRRVEAAGVEAIVLTVDAPVLGRRERDVHNRFSLPPELELANLIAEGHRELPAQPGESGLAAYAASLLDPDLSWETLDWLRRLTDLPVLVKGIVRLDDAVPAAEAGAAGVVVSNHGGRQLDTAPATAAVLPRIADALAAAGHETELLVDGGVRRGTDVLKALALGARGVMVGRPVLWGLAVDGRGGAERVLQGFADEVDRAMALAGCRSLAEIDRDLVRRRAEL